MDSTELNLIIKKIVSFCGFDFSQPSYSIMSNEKRYVTIHDFATDRKIRQHLRGIYSICLQRFPHTKVYCIDVDCHDGNTERVNKTIKLIVENIGEPIFLEKSENNGYHLYFKFKNFLYTDTWENLEKWFFDTYEMKIETITRNKKFKLPFSKAYQTFGTYKDKDDFIEQKTIFECLSVLENSEGITSCQLLNKLPFYGKESEKKLPEINKDLEYGVWNNFYYGEGERTSNQFKMAIRSVFWNKSYEDFKKECYIFNVNSKDMRNWSQFEIEKDLQDKWRKANKLVQPLRFNDFDSEKKCDFFFDDYLYNNVLGEEEKDKLKDILSEVYEKKDGKIKVKFIDDCIKFYKACLVIQKYRQKRKMFYIESEFKFLNKGIPLSQGLRKKMGNYLKINNHQKVYWFLVKNNILKTIKNEKGYSYSYKIFRWCQHFMISSVEELCKVVKEVIEKVNKFFDILEKFYYNNNIGEVENYNTC